MRGPSLPRRRLLAGLAALLPAPAAGQGPPPAREPGPPQRPSRDFDGWWERQREREASDRFWNGPRERRRALTRDQFERWETQRDRRSGRPAYPF